MCPASVSPSRFTVQWQITERCDHACAHCYMDAERPIDLPTEVLLGIAARLEEFAASRRAQHRQTVRIMLSGGEPLVRHDFFELLMVLVRAHGGGNLALLTNGALIDEHTARRLANFGLSFVQVSIEGRPATHDRIRGFGDHERVVNCLRLLRAHGVRTSISFTAHRDNYSEFIEVARLGRTLGASRVWTDRFVPLGQARDLADKVLTPEQTAEFVAQIRAAQLELPPGRNTEVGGNRALQFLRCMGRPYTCTAGQSLLAIQPDGAVLPCRRLPVPVGNILSSSLESIYNESRQLRVLRDAPVPEACRGCCFGSLCRGGLRCLAWATLGDPSAADPGCWLAAAPLAGADEPCCEAVTPRAPASAGFP